MIDTARHLMQCGFHVVYAYTQSDEISLLFHPRERAFGRLLRKYHSILAGEASAKFSLLLGELVCFDCRVAELPDVDRAAVPRRHPLRRAPAVAAPRRRSRPGP